MSFETTLNINTINVGAFEAKVADANKIAKRLKLEEITFVYGETSSIVRQGVYGKIRDTFVDVTITGEYPSFTGWDFVTLLDHEANLVRSFGETNHRHLVGDTTCHHCNTKRSRSKTFVISNGEKEMQVGGACLKYYIPTKSVHSLTSFYSAFDDIMDGDYVGGGSYTPYYPVKDIVAWAWIDVQERGYHGANSGERPTRSIVSAMISPAPGEAGKEDRELRDDLLNRFDFTKAEEKAAEIVDWVNALEAKSDFEFNVKSGIEKGIVNYKGFGFTCAAIVAFNKAQEKDVLAKRKQQEVLVSNYIGEVKKRQEFELTLEHVFVSGGYYGDTYIHKFQDINGNVVTWFGTKRLTNKYGSTVEITDTVKVKATVKEHSEYNDVKQTVVQRVTAV